jgi:hypothetical protein
MRLETNDLVTGFFEKVKDEYPDLSYNDIKEIVLYPWFYLKDIMENGSFENVRLKYFGEFSVPLHRAKKLLEEAKIRFSKQWMTPKQFFKIKNNLETYIANYEEPKED